jgi:hypothetical protein
MVGAAAAQEPNPEPLWKAYPLDDKGAAASGGQSGSTTTTPRSPAAATTRQPLTVTDEAGDGPPWLLMIAAGAGGALFVVVLLTLQGRRARRREEALVGVADEWPWLTAKPRGEFRGERLKNAPGRPAMNGVASGVAERERVEEPAASGAAERAGDEERAEPERPAEPERAANGVAARGGDEERAEPKPPAEPEPVANGAAEPVGAEGRVEHGFDVAEADAVPRHRFDREPVRPNGRASAARRGPICQVRWSAPGTCFYAVTSDADGVERRVAWSPPIEWNEPGPPDEESREARAALRVLSKELRDKGWRPMRAKGADFDETRWYARRFRLPVSDEAREPATQAQREA